MQLEESFCHLARTCCFIKWSERNYLALVQNFKQLVLYRNVIIINIFFTSIKYVRRSHYESMSLNLAIEYKDGGAKSRTTRSTFPESYANFSCAHMAYIMPYIKVLTSYYIYYP